MDRVCIDKAIGKIIEMQSGGDDIPELMAARLDTLRLNAINAGYKEIDIVVKWVTGEELAELMKPDPIEVSAQEAKAKLAEIDLKSIRSIREWVAKHEDAPQYIKDCEVLASAERAKL